MESQSDFSMQFGYFGQVYFLNTSSIGYFATNATFLCFQNAKVFECSNLFDVFCTSVTGNIDPYLDIHKCSNLFFISFCLVRTHFKACASSEYLIEVNV